MALPLDETITEGQAAHIADHQTIADVLNTAFGGVSPAAALSATYAAINDPLAIGFVNNAHFQSVDSSAGSVQGTANWTVYSSWQAAGYAISSYRVKVNASSGNICLAAYASSGSGVSRVPTTRLATSGSVACPSIGMADVSLGATITPSLTGYSACAADNTTANLARRSPTVTAAQTMTERFGRDAVENVFPCPASASPAATSAAGALAAWLTVGV